MQAKFAPVTHSHTARGPMFGVTIDDQEHQASLTAHQSFEEFDEHPTPIPPLTIMKRNAPRWLTAEILFRLDRCPVTRTIGGPPRTAQVRRL